MTRKVFFSVPMERIPYDQAVNALIDVAMEAGRLGYRRITTNYMRIDSARNLIVNAFMEVTSDPDDTLIMLDCDHRHPQNVLEHLASFEHEIGVIGALYFRRGEPYDPLFFPRADGVEGGYLRPVQWEKGIYEVEHVATGAMAIKRWVFEELNARGLGGPFWFQYEYPADLEVGMLPGEDTFFAKHCEQAGIWHYVDTNLVTEHLEVRAITEVQFREHLAKHPELLENLTPHSVRRGTVELKEIAL